MLNLRAETDLVGGKLDAMTEELELVTLRPKKTDIAVQLVSLAWAPFRGGQPAW